jgi:hypothetical protein
MQEIEKEQKARDKKSARLRALRLAKEAEDKERTVKAEAERLAAAEKTLKTAAKKAPRRRQKAAAAVSESPERPTQHG